MNTVSSSAAYTAPAIRGPAPRREAAASRLAARTLVLATGLVLPLLLLGLWQYAVSRHWLAEQILPAPALVWQSLRELWESGDLVSNLSISLVRLGASLAIGGGAGLLLGLAMGVSPSVKAYLYPAFQLVSQFPVIGWVPLLIIFAGIGEALKISAISIAVVVPVAVNTYKGIRNIPHAALEVAAVYRFTFRQKLRHLVLPAASSSIFNGLRQGVMQAWLSLVFVELLASSEGIGYLMVWGRQLLQLDIVVVGMLVIGAVGVTLDRLLAWGESRLHAWQRPAY
jgi:sulfonate transport system permease protein